MEGVARLSWIAVALASVAAIIQPFAVLEPLFLALICVSMCLVLVGVVRAQRAQRDLDEAVVLQNRWRIQRDRCKPATWSYTPAPVLQNATPPPEPEPEPENEIPVSPRRGRDLIFEEANQ